MGQSALQRSFAAGELAPAFAARADLAKYTTGLRTCRNFLVRRAGGVANRPGFEFRVEVKNSEAPTFLFPFVFAAANESYLIEAGEHYLRFHHQDTGLVHVSSVAAWSAVTAYVPSDLVAVAGVNYYCILAHTNQTPPNATYWYALPGTVYEVPTTYPTGSFQNPTPLYFSQSGFTITITHLGHPPRELRYNGATPKRWTLVDVVTGPGIAAPGSPVAVAGTVGTRTFAYIVTAVLAETYEESYPSVVASVGLADAPTADAPHVVSWAAVAGAVEYNIYADPYENGTFGFLGVATGALTFQDVDAPPDFARTAPIVRSLFTTPITYPAVSAVLQQRRFFAGTHTNREDVFGSQIGKLANYSIRSPLQDDDAITWRLASNRIQPVLHLVALKQLVLLTDSGEWLAQGSADGGLLPTAINLEQHGYVGSSYLQPVVIGNAILFVQARGTILRDLSFDERVQGLSGRDLTPLATHLFNGYTLVDLDYAQVPDSIVWCVRSDGTLLGLTYVKEDDVYGWHRHDTDGVFEQVCVLPQGDHDAVYVIVARQVGGNIKRYIERLGSRDRLDANDLCFVDSSVTYDGAPTTTITGLGHLEGKTVSVAGDGAKVPGTFVVTSGAVTLPSAKSVVHVGLPITAELETLDLDVAGSSVRDQRKRVNNVSLVLNRSARGFLTGPDAAHLTAQRAEPWQGTGLVTGHVEMALESTYGTAGRVLVRHTDPTPLEVLAIIPNVTVGG